MWKYILCFLISTTIFLGLYFKGKVYYSTRLQLPVLRCHPLAENCKVFPPSSPYTRWERTECQDLDFNSLKCKHIQSEHHFIMKTLSKEEEDYPLAFIITIYKDLEMFVRLLRAIYAPHNVYCIHIDDKAQAEYKLSVQRLAECFPNVFLASVSEIVTYGGFSRLKADINCMEDLVRSPVKWRKVINLCGQDFPVHTKLELVRYMQDEKWKDKNMTPGVKQPVYIRHRTEIQHKEITGHYVTSLGQDHKKTPAPHNLTIYFGTAYYSLQRAFVEYVLTSPVAKDLLEWSRDTYSPDEHYWVTLNHLEDAPGSNVNAGWGGNIRAIKWKDQEGSVHQGCKGMYIRDICIYDVEDLPWIIERNSMFANKLDTTRFPEALDCLEQWHRHKVLQQATVPIQLSWQLATEVDITDAGHS
ncbi:beta-1,3-galactosyl-O-glycosyl-glycoprotein beta-1,6-N-acetylglucosaminyltransferase 7-like [Tachysurus vachellii]|uniref:beta-1,3-galactosyl-O-glycosyl-glycoprotein beta-1,6-N-acetylglucosaminyltransferase 7-like n=1 Tax=Tachysurus vachellii TaxID=175792 RepID=UPI00296B222A|nr:beta-1,3-galactosyl-O-glycosyl-glycoprotein beta-1,6-N-acetylglucosaminyltransferase 7-like [Tachysurus vachellii]